MILALISLAGASTWEVLQEGPIEVACGERDGAPWCRAAMTVDASAAAVAEVIADVARYPEVFPRVTSVTELEPDVVHVVLGMPFPLIPRDYVARFSRREDGGGVWLSWEAVEHPDAPQLDTVRLTDSAGAWRVKPLPAGGSEVVYTWNAELGGDVPAWALRRAWRMQGLEVLGNLSAAVQ